MFLNLVKITIATIALLAIIIFLILPINLPYSIQVPGKVLPQKEWVLSKSDNGMIFTQLINNKTGVNEDFFVTQFERGDAVKFELFKDENNFSVSKNDTIGIIHSNEIDVRLVQLQGKLTETKASLKSNLTGNKSSIIKAAKEKLAFEIEKSNEQKKILARLKEMYEKNLISTEEYEIAQNESNLNDINISITKAQLETVQTGEKPEQIQIINSQILSIENEISILQKRLSNFMIITPISGTVNQLAKSDTILFVADTSSFVILMPLNIKEKNYLANDVTIDLQLPYNKKTIEAKYYGMDNKVQIFNNTQVVMIKAILDKNKLDFLPGMYLQCTLHLGKLSIKDRIDKIFQRVF
ncbi:MAG: hypothetical protein COW08_05915 [Ignavibacteriales bacterium CG12_big_fil_rev_8_21_14_0_65_30_8]|nr:MAG: hypothetical protein COW08_05915 [Ignavibacteriales bacterium CG12_big_fil_rev_8_21_14_0_65_30_8]